jgi:hypothetical protein
VEGFGLVVSCAIGNDGAGLRARVKLPCGENADVGYNGDYTACTMTYFLFDSGCDSYISFGVKYRTRSRSLGSVRPIQSKYRLETFAVSS